MILTTSGLPPGRVFYAFERLTQNIRQLPTKQTAGSHRVLPLAALPAAASRFSATASRLTTHGPTSGALRGAPLVRQRHCPLRGRTMHSAEKINLAYETATTIIHSVAAGSATHTHSNHTRPLLARASVLKPMALPAICKPCGSRGAGTDAGTGMVTVRGESWTEWRIGHGGAQVSTCLTFMPTCFASAAFSSGAGYGSSSCDSNQSSKMLICGLRPGC